MKTVVFSIFLLLTSCLIFSQEIGETETKEKAYTPTIGIGAGTVGFYGDLNDKEFGSPLAGNLGYNIYLFQPITSYLQVKLNFTIAEIRAEERSLARNVNFNTDLRAGAILLEYTFDNFLPSDRKITPFITVGIEAIEFNPKTDIEGYGGEKYNYWSDGTIRNLAENSPNAQNSVLVSRDYSYETDIRDAGFNPTKDYAENTLAIPMGLGVTMHLNDQLNFRFESIFHYTFSDYIDGITPETSSEYVNNKPGNSLNDHFWFNGISLNYNFQKIPTPKRIKKFDDTPVDFLTAEDQGDFDKDGIIDLLDRCPNTPSGEPVDSLGCPIDEDKDGVADYKDDELNTEYPEFANDKGVEMTDDMIYKSYLNYIDSTEAIAETIERNFSGNKAKRSVYKVQLNELNSGETPSEVGSYLNLPDLNKIDQNEKTIYAAGNFRTLDAAKNRLLELSKLGFDDLVIIKKSLDGSFKKIGPAVKKTTPIKGDNSSNSIETESDEQLESQNNSEVSQEDPDADVILFRVQLGAFKNKPTAENSKNIPDLYVEESGGYYRYLSGSYDNFQDAATHKINMGLKGYKGGFVVAYKNGIRVSLKSVGVKTITSDPIIGK